MKKVIRTVAMLALMFTTANSIANNPKLIVDGANRSMTISLEADSDVQSISIVDVDGNVIYSENVKEASAYSKRFNLVALKDGVYTLTAKSNQKEIAYDVKIEKSDLQIIEKKELSKPVFSRVNDKVLLNFLNLDREDVTVRISDTNDRIVYEDTLKNVAIVEKSFNFEKAFEDNYTITVKRGNSSYSESVEVK
ncbi:MAG: T9SS type A sorting domain-containing protein [Flavobacteriaceae bacterium]